tara:strand:+ start:2228 stop:2446 length:219 start_codon:yes stop_codon:yes gene_type:complete
MVEYNPKGKLPQFEDRTENENYNLKRSLDSLLSMIISGRSLTDIRRVANRIADEVAWPYLRKKHTPLEMEEE